MKQHVAGLPRALLRVKRAYDPPERDDGLRVLVDRLWPRGLRKEAAKVDLWLKDIAPSNALRRWYGHEPERWEEFAHRYHLELRKSLALLRPLREALKHRQTVTLLFAARDVDRNNAVVLKTLLENGTRS